MADPADPDRLADLAPGDEPTFEAPWQARAFALAVALSEDLYEWETFQTRLAAEIEGWDPDQGADPEAVYYEQWLGALERLLVEEGHLPAGALAERVRAFAEGDRTAHEFVRGDPHGHADDDGGHGHDHH